MKKDTDGDALLDGWEVQHNLNPLAIDTDRDSMLDDWEVGYNLDPINNDANADADVMA